MDYMDKYDPKEIAPHQSRAWYGVKAKVAVK